MTCSHTDSNFYWFLKISYVKKKFFFSNHYFFTLEICLNRAVYIDGLVQERRNSIANTLELRLSCTNPSIQRKKERESKSLWPGDTHLPEPMVTDI